MTRRDRHIRFLDNFGGLNGIRATELDSFIARHGLAVFTDEAIAKLAAHKVADWRFTRRLNRRNRAIRTA